MTATVPSREQAELDRLLARARQIGDEETKKLLARTPGSAQLYQRAYKTLPFGVVSSFQKGSPYPIYASRGKGQPRLGPGWHGVPRLPRRLRRHGGGARPSPDRRGDHRGGEPGHPLRRHDGRRGGLRGGDLPPVQSGDAALRQLRHRGHHGRDPGGARRHRPRRGLQDRGLLPRPPRCGDVLGRPQRRRHGRAGTPCQGAGLPRAW